MEMHEIKYFLAACRTLNFHRAAELSHVSQPALTRAVHKLEAELGGHLFHRERSHIRLTDFGRLMRSHLEQVLQQADTAKVAAKSFLKLEAAPLTLGVMCTIGPLRFVGFLNDFREQHPGIEVSVIENVPGRLSQLLLDGTLDIALMAQPNPFDARLSVAPIFCERFGLAFPVGHRFEQRNTLHVTDVRGENYLSRINCEYRDYLGELCSQHGVAIRRAYRSEREDWIMAMVAAGMGICFLPEFSAVHPGIRHRLVTEPEVVREVSLVSVAGRTFPPAVSAFVKAVREYDWAAGATSAGGLAR
jgi:LysR family transcriptional regulator, hydrogen peroxide-inducible genes activator